MATRATPEEERKYDVGSSFRLPDLTSIVAQVRPQPVKTLTATYFDTDDLRLARAGASLRYRSGDDLPWTVKLATEVPEVRQEISSKGKPGRVPEELAWLVASHSRGATLGPVAVLRTRRRRYDLCGDGGEVLAELADDRVWTQTRRFREIEVERKAGPAALLSIVEEELLAAGASPSDYPSKLARALGEPAEQPPEAIPPSSQAPDTAGDVVMQAVRSGVRRIVEHDPLVRLGDPLPNGDTPVHQMRVGCRRLRSDLKTFGSVVEKAWVAEVRGELRWIAGLLGAARDVEVLRARLRRTASADSLAKMDDAAIDWIDSSLKARQATALANLAEGMRSERYLALLNLLTEATHAVAFKKRAARPPESLRAAAEKPAGLAEPAADAPDEVWHELRIKVKRARYAVEAVRDRKDPAAKTLAKMQDLLGEHQDASVAAETWLSFADPVPSAAPRDSADRLALAVTAGRLYERERAAIREMRSAFSALWPQAEI